MTVSSRASLWTGCQSCLSFGPRPFARSSRWSSRRTGICGCAPSSASGISDGRIRLRAPNRYHKEWFEDNFLPPILQDLEARAQRSFMVDFEVIEERRRVECADAPAVPAPRSRRPGGTTAARARRPNLVSRYTFDKFVVGPTNQFAHAAARMVAEAPASRWNPLFIYGGVGLGKTHLLHAIGHEIHQQHPDWVISFVTCEGFVTDFIGSMMNQKRQGGTSSWRSSARATATRPTSCSSTTSSSCRTRTARRTSSSTPSTRSTTRTSRSSSRPTSCPRELPGVEDRLRSRFTWGLIGEVETPDLETRVAILKRKAEVEKVILPDDVALYLAAHVKTNVRELEGALLRLAARASFQAQPITLELARDALQKLFANTPTGLTIESIQREVAAYFDVKLHDLKGPKRHRAIAHPRMIAMFLARKLTTMSYPEIGSRFGGKDHSTVISAVRKIERLCAEDPTVRSVVNTIESHLRQP